MASSKTTNRKSTVEEFRKTPKKAKSSGRSSAKNNTAKAHGLSLMAAIILGLFAAFVLELSNFDIFGIFGGWLKYGQFGLFGIMAYVFPIVVLLLFILSTYDEKRGLLILALSALFLFVCALAHLFSSLSLQNQNILSYFTISAESLTGGGILGGIIALGLYLLLSETGAVIILILLILVCLFLLFEEPILHMIDEWKMRIKDGRKERALRPRRTSVHREEDEEDLSQYYQDKYYQKLSDQAAKQRRARRKTYDEPVYVTEDEQGTVIRIVRSYKKHGRVHQTTLTRSNKKAQPLRNAVSESNVSRNVVKARGISTELDMIPHNANGDEIHEITRRRKNTGSKAAQKSAGSALFANTVIPPEEERPEWKDIAGRQMDVFEYANGRKNEAGTEQKAQNRKKESKEAAVTRVREAAVNQRAIEARPVKVPKNDTSKPKKDLANLAPVTVMPEDPEAYQAPPMDLLAPVKGRSKSSEAELQQIAQNLEIILEQFGVHVNVTDIQAGPSVTRFELQPELGTRVNKITSLADDLKLNLGVTEIRIEAPIPGRQAVGIEIPNKNRQTVYMRELLQEPTLINHSSKIAFAAGKDISGNVVVADIAKMPHLLVAGTTGSGKSVFLNTILMTILYRAKPSEVGLIIIDPKKVEFGVYAGIPHLMKDVVTDPGQAVSTLRWAVNEMTNRYQRMQLSSVRDFKTYNSKVEKGTVNPAEENPRKMNQIIIIIDELADLMMVAKKEAEALICRLAQLARAAGIHLIIATQRPSVDVVTGLIKANVPGRVALLVSSQIDSRTIIDMPGAEKLLGNGDMLFYPTGYVKPLRVQGAYVSDDEIMATVDFLIRNNQTDYFAAESQEIEKFMNSDAEGNSSGDAAAASEDAGKYDEYFYEAGKVCIEMGKASSSMLQRRFNLGFNRAARIIDQLEEFGAVGPQNGAKPREILVDTMTFEEMYQDMMKKN